MKRGFAIAVALIILLSSFAFSYEIISDSMVAEANILEPVVSISVPTKVLFGNITKGYSTDDIRIDLNNTGNTDIKITPALENSTERIFSNLYFARRTTESYYKIGNFSMNISKPSSIGGVRSDYCYAKLDLTNYQYDINQDIMKHNATVIFWVMPV